MRKLFFVVVLFLMSGCHVFIRASDFVIEQGKPLSVLIDKQEQPVVHTALEIFCSDYAKVFGDNCRVVGNGAKLVVGTVGVSQVVEQLPIRTKKFKRLSQGFLIKVLDDGTLAVVGSDAHGTAYGLMELSRLIGVSPWEWWADVTPERQKQFVLHKGYETLQSPSVEYRGIFINDEDWGLMPWSYQTYEKGHPKGVIGPKTHERVFELMLRLRANMFWPAMHECTHPFFLTEGNREVAARYGIYIGGSHCEPMASSTAGEWPLRGNGAYDYVNNADAVRDFWRQRVKEVAGQEVIYTVGMRGVHDGKMQGAKTITEQKNVLQTVIADQRQLLKEHVNADVKKVPQVFIPYKEVLDVYHAGLQVPEDITLMWCDDNYGYIRHFPTEAEQQRVGGNGIYYHVSYWGRPHDYLWLCTVSPGLIHQQMTAAYDNGIRKMWVLNVGDIKPCEYQIELFMDMAWNIQAVSEVGVEQHLKNFMTREFGAKNAGELLPTLLEYYRLAYIRKPEFMGNTRVEEKAPEYKIVKDLPWSETYIRQRMSAYKRLSDDVERIAKNIPTDRKTAYYQLVQYPVQATAQMNIKHLSAQLARHGLVEWHVSDAAYDSIVALTQRYNDVKWEGIMDMHPRRLPVFAQVKHEQTDVPLSADVQPIVTINAADITNDEALLCPLLGYSGQSAKLPKGKTLSFTFDVSLPDTVVVQLSFVPTHPIDNDLRVRVTFDDEDLGTVSYKTQGRSEEWKQNVLRNQSVKDMICKPSKRSNHQLKIKALDDRIILDRIQLFVHKNE